MLRDDRSVTETTRGSISQLGNVKKHTRRKTKNTSPNRLVNFPDATLASAVRSLATETFPTRLALLHLTCGCAISMKPTRQLLPASTVPINIHFEPEHTVTPRCVSRAGSKRRSKSRGRAACTASTCVATHTATAAGVHERICLFSKTRGWKLLLLLLLLRWVTYSS